VDGLLVALVGDTDSEVRSSAAEVLGNIGDARAVVGLIEALNDTAEGRYGSLVCGDAAEALEKIGTPEALEAVQAWREKEFLRLLVALAGDADSDVRHDAADALGHMSDARAVEGLLAALAGDADSKVRSNAAYALGRISDARAVDGLLMALAGDADSDVRSFAAHALRKIGDARAVQGLREALNDTARYWSGSRVCDAAADALKRIGTREALEAVRAWRTRGG
jgi:HEAT repeat protein